MIVGSARSESSNELGINDTRHYDKANQLVKIEPTESERILDKTPKSYTCDLADCRSHITGENLTASAYSIHMVSQHSSEFVCNTDDCENLSFAN